ncbi:MAG: hypothetical protein E5Y32_07430 [Mesorhizobium sp.]|uniref:hypothetical protein n=1 Tax=unclassified Mesorhizobium TaxID=325217 RepID=UPI000FEA880B|nr:hypothetical protein [Mesorhizobium sp.]RWA97239.1 MAG: hypothetical protein EOQ33_32335 [Mesorhizobium sp.]RWN57671.1 MAG: hypothetical protein EOR99_34375 [Mesorhizobium sp.]RWO23526.1 MAG: hypothetical protein EOS10_33610 [Mesorhizobium sp.]RWO73687.1 MAG: hypothetical protein EOS18_33005 [Mesorhizobium sp.]RWQ69989.1 MAG: hypothetical protein EOS85_27735 [Mesorhizobium sp.]
MSDRSNTLDRQATRFPANMGALAGIALNPRCSFGSVHGATVSTHLRQMKHNHSQRFGVLRVYDFL